MSNICFVSQIFFLSMACENKSAQKRKRAMFSLTEIEVAKQLIQLSNSVTVSSTTHLDDEDHHSFNSYSVERKSQQSNDDDSGDKVEDVLAEIEQDKILRRKNNRYRYIHDLYNVTEPVVHVRAAFEAKTIKFMNRH